MKKNKSDIKFKDRKIVKWAKENAPEVIGKSLDLVGDITGLEVLENLGEKIAGSDQLTEDQKAQAAEILKAEIEIEKEISNRWKYDMESDSWLSKNVRPFALLAVILMLFVFITLDSCNIEFEIKESWIKLYEFLLLAIVGAYYGARSWEKYQRNKTRN